MSDKIADLAGEMVLKIANINNVFLLWWGIVLRGSVRVLENYRYLCNLFNK